MGSSYPFGERRKGFDNRRPEIGDDGGFYYKFKGFHPYPLNVGTIMNPGRTIIGDLPDEESEWRIRRDKFVLRPKNIDDICDGGKGENGWEDVQKGMRKVEICSIQKEVKTVYRCVFTNGNNILVNKERTYHGKRQ